MNYMTAPNDPKKTREIVMKYYPKEKYDQLLKVVASSFEKITEKDITGRCRKQIYVIPRHIFIYLAMKHIGGKKIWIARYLNNRDHSTIDHSLTVSQGYIDTGYSPFIDELTRLETIYNIGINK